MKFQMRIYPRPENETDVADQVRECGGQIDDLTSAPEEGYGPPKNLREAIECVKMWNEYNEYWEYTLYGCDDRIQSTFEWELLCDQ